MFVKLFYLLSCKGNASAYAWETMGLATLVPALCRLLVELAELKQKANGYF